MWNNGRFLGVVPASARQLRRFKRGAGYVCHRDGALSSATCSCHNEIQTTRPAPPRLTARLYIMSSELIKHISDASFDGDVVKADKPVLVDYWAEWCGPCKMIAPILDEVATTYDGRLQVAKMNVDENREVPAKFGIRGIPTLMLFKNGQLAATKVGALSKAQLTAFIDQNL
jgi:thioredoxin 1